MLKFRGHHFFGDSFCACCVADERMVSIDPTGTGPLRRAFNSALAIKWRGMRVLARRMIVDQDILSMGSKGLMAIANPAIQGGATRTQMFQRWFDYILQGQLLGGDGSFMRDYIKRGYDAGRTFAQNEVGFYASPLAGDRQDTLFQLAVVELQGIIEAVSQRAVRAVATGLLHGSRPATIAREVNRAIDSVGVPRSTALVELITVKAFSEASLDVYESAGVKRVGLVPETLIASPKDARRVTPTGPAGARSRRGEGPGLRTIQRIRKQELGIATAAGALVRVKTAGDKKVCQRCRLIAKRGPYKINRARSLIPAHPRCRCVFVPVVTAKKRDGIPSLDYDPNQPRDPDGKWGSGGGSAGAAHEINPMGGGLKGNSSERVGMRKQLKSETDPAKRRALQQGILDSFQKQINKKGGDVVLQAKMEKYSRMYGGMRPTGMAPGPVAITTPTALSRNAIAKNTAARFATSGRTLHVYGNGESKAKVQAGISDIPAAHQDKLARLGITVTSEKSLPGYNGVYTWRAGRGSGNSVRVGDAADMGGIKLAVRDPRGTTVHELGHAIDHSSNWRHGEALAKYVDADYAKLHSFQREYGKYYVSNNKEKFAELYRATYSKGGTAFGLKIEAAREKFKVSIAKMKELEDII